MKDLTKALSPHFNELNLANVVYAYVGSPFIMKWLTGGTYEDGYGDEQQTPTSIRLPLSAECKCDFVVDGATAREVTSRLLIRRR